MEKNIQKKEIRSRVGKFRREMPESLWEEATAQIAQRLLNLQSFGAAEEIYCYVDYNHEVGTRQIIEACWKRKKRVFVPKVLGTEMEFFEIFQFEDLETKRNGMKEPLQTTEELRGGGRSGLMIMPGVAFDRKLHRVGYGGGFYDRYLEKHKELQTVAIAFEYQVFDKIPAEVFDICPGKLITESAIYEKEL